MATKEMERKALDKIRKIVSELGDDSYVATAFEGCFEVADRNIDNDWLCSLLQRAESAENLLKEALDEMHKAQNEAKLLKTENIGLREKVLGKDSVEKLSVIVQKRIDWLNERIDVTVDQIVELAENPADAEFVRAVQENRRLEGEKRECEVLEYELNARR